MTIPEVTALCNVLVPGGTTDASTPISTEDTWANNIAPKEFAGIILDIPFHSNSLKWNWGRQLKETNIYGNMASSRLVMSRCSIDWSAFIFRNGGRFVSIYHNKMAFSTKDRDNDLWPYTCNYAVTYTGTWWNRGCFKSNLNGKYLRKNLGYGTSVNWAGKRFISLSLKFTELKLGSSL